jgi:hypothetical protein
MNNRQKSDCGIAHVQIRLDRLDLSRDDISIGDAEYMTKLRRTPYCASSGQFRYGAKSLSNGYAGVRLCNGIRVRNGAAKTAPVDYVASDCSSFSDS